MPGYHQIPYTLYYVVAIDFGLYLYRSSRYWARGARIDSMCFLLTLDNLLAKELSRDFRLYHIVNRWSTMIRTTQILNQTMFLYPTLTLVTQGMQLVTWPSSILPITSQEGIFNLTQRHVIWSGINFEKYVDPCCLKICQDVTTIFDEIALYASL